MKKLISLVLALALVLSLGMTAFAANVDTEGGTASTEVVANYSAGTAGGTVFSVDIEWSGMSFTYNGKSEPVWDPTTHTYSGADKEEGWAESNALITITNHSNAFIEAVPSYQKASGYESVSMTFSTRKCYVGSADNGLGSNGAGQAVSETISVTPTGTLPEGTTDAVIGTVTVTITEMEDITVNQADGLVTAFNETRNDVLAEGGKVDSADEVESGQRYILSSDYDILYAKMSALSEARWNYENGGGTEELQAALNQAWIDLYNCADYFKVKP